MSVTYATHVFHPPPSIRPQIVNQKVKNHPTAGFQTIHFHRLAYTDSQTSSALAAQEDEVGSFSDLFEWDEPINSQMSGSGPKDGSTSEVGRAHVPGRLSPSRRDRTRAYRSLNEDFLRIPLEDNLIARQTGRSASDTEEASSRHGNKSKSVPVKRKLLDDIVPDSTRKKTPQWPRLLDTRMLDLSDSVLDTPEQTVSRKSARLSHISLSTPSNRPLRSEPILLAGETDPRPKGRSKLARAQTLAVDTPGQISNEERSAIWLERLHSFKTRSRLSVMQNMVEDTPISRKGESSRFAEHIIDNSGKKFVTSTQIDNLSGNERDVFHLGNETGMGWPEPILPRRKSSNLAINLGLERSLLPTSKASSSEESHIVNDEPRLRSTVAAGNLPISYSTDGSRSIASRADCSYLGRDHDSSPDKSASLAPDSAIRPGGGAAGLDWSDSWELTPTGGKRSKRIKTVNGENTTTVEGSHSGWLSTGREQSISQDVRPTGSTESDMFSQTLNPTGKTGSGLITSQSQSICTFPSYLAIPANSLTDLTELLNMPPDGESRRVDLLAVVWEVGQTERFSAKCEVQLCQPIGNGRADDSAGWGTRKTLLRVDFWDEYASDVKRLKSGDVVWIKNLDHKRKAEKDAAYRARPRFVSTVSSRRPQASYPTNITIMYRAMPDRYYNRGPTDHCEECAAATMIRDVVRGETRQRGEDAEAVCARHKGKISAEDQQYRPDRRLLESEIGMRRVRKLVDWVEATFVSRF